MDVCAVADPAIGVAEIEHVVGVDEADDPADVEEQAARDVLRVTHRMRALLARDRQIGVRRHRRDDATRGAIDLKDVVDEEAARAIRTISDEGGIERHRWGTLVHRAHARNASSALGQHAPTCHVAATHAR